MADPPDSIELNPAPPRRNHRTQYDRRETYPPCPECGEPIVTVWTFGPDRHNADPCGCGLTAHQVKHLTRRGER